MYKSKMSVMLVLVAVILLTAGSIGWGQEKGSTATVVLKLASYGSPNVATIANFQWWGDEIEKRAGGRIKIQWYHSEALAKAVDLLNAAKIGLADACFMASAYLPAELPLQVGGTLPYISPKVEAPGRAMQELYKNYPPVRNEWERNNVILCYGVPMPPIIIGSKKPVRALEDIKGMKIRTVGLWAEVMKRLGAVPVAIAWPEIYEALQRGTIDMYSVTSLITVPGMRWWEIAKYIVDPGIGYYGTCQVVMNKGSYNRLPAELRAIVDQVNAEALTATINIYLKSDSETTKFLKEKGVEVSTLSAQEAAKWRAAVSPEQMWDDWAKETKKKYGLPADEFLAKYLELISKYAATARY